MPAFEFPDNRDRLYGREEDAQYLLGRVATSGLTAVVARPQCGKTWLFYEVARRLAEEGNVLVGYHENKGESPDLLKRAVADLVQRWLEDASMWEQAKNLSRQWTNGEPIIKAGIFAGKVTEALAKLTGFLPEAVASKLGDLFTGFADAQEMLKTGGLALQPLDYDQAHDVVSLVHGVSGRSVVLILDAWEKSPDLGREQSTLSSFLKHTAEWAPCHILPGVRAPDPDRPERGDEAQEAVRVMCQGSILAAIYDLPPLHLDSADEQQRLIVGVRADVPSSAVVSDAAILTDVGGFAGVLGRWREVSPKTIDDFTRVADEAKSYIFGEFTDGLRRSLTLPEYRFALRISLFPRLDAGSWELFREVLLDDIDDECRDNLTTKRVLIEELYPTYGHDVRHTVARRWLIEGKRASPAKELEDLALRIAARICDTRAEVGPFVVALMSLASVGAAVSISAVVYALVAAAGTLVGLPANISALRNAASVLAGKAAVAPLVAMGLVNALARATEAAERTALLGELRALAKAHPGEPAVREQLANGLVSQIVYHLSEGERSKAAPLVDELAALLSAHADDPGFNEVAGLLPQLRNALREGA